MMKMLKNRILLSTSVACLVSTVLPVLSQADDKAAPMDTAGDTTQSVPADSSASTQTTKLTGGVEQKEQIVIPASPATTGRKALPKMILEVPKLDTVEVPVVPKFLQAGTQFDQKTYPKEGNVWYKIPKFLAGHWKCDEKTILSTTNLATGRENDTPKTEEFHSEINQGFQQDNTGQIWHFDNAPFMGHSQLANNETHYSYVQSITPISCTEDKFVRRTILVKAELNGSDIVKTSKQFELIQSLTPFGPDKVREDSISRPIGQEGPGWKNTSTTIFTLDRPFTPINQSKGRDMREMFREYLESNGMSNLIPKT